MDKEELLEMLNQDLADEHASIIRYLIHAYQVGDDTPLGNMLLTTAREEMWHMNWLGDEIGERGWEPDLVKGPYPYDGTSNASLLRSYIEWEDNLIEVYEQQAAELEDGELKRIVQQLGWESLTHSRRFAYWLEKLGPEGEEPLEFEPSDFTEAFARRLDNEVDVHYKLVLQHLRHAFIFEEPICPVGSELELTAMRHMKHMSYFAEELGERGHELEFEFPGIDLSDMVNVALASDFELTDATRERLSYLSQFPETEQHGDLKLEIENMVTRNGLLLARLKGLAEEAQETEAGVEPPVVEEDLSEDDASDTPPSFTVGTLIDK
jgi:bacterioferritin